MKLYSMNLSPFAARARLAVYAKGLDMQIGPPDEHARTPGYAAVNPIGKLPALVLDDGTVIPESDTIIEYLEDAFPEPALLPAGAEDRAKARLIARAAELYVQGPIGKLYSQMDPATRDQAVVDPVLDEIRKGLEYINVFLSGGRFAVGDAFSKADCVLVPTLSSVETWLSGFGRDLFAGLDKLNAYRASLKGHAESQKVVAEMTTAGEIFMRERKVT
jgi:glutathione S-transferase